MLYLQNSRPNKLVMADTLPYTYSIGRMLYLYLIWRMSGTVIRRYGYIISLEPQMIRGQVVRFVLNSMLKY